MGTGKQDSRIREQLDRLQQAPEPFQFRSALVWQQIETRLTEKKRRHFGWLYGTAAAVLLCAGGWWLLQHKKTPDAKPASPFVSTPTRTKPGKDTLQKVIDREVQPYPSNLVTVRQTGKQGIKVIPSTSQQTPVAGVDSSGPLVVSAPPADSLSMPITIAKPRFRIAHINELDNNSSDPGLAQQPLKKKPLISTFLFSPKDVTEDMIVKENMGYMEAKPRGILRSVQITKD